MSHPLFPRLAEILVPPSAALLLVSACSQAPRAAGAADKPGVTRRDNRIVHQECAVNGSGVEAVNVSGDSRPDMVIVRSGGHEVCRSLDLNFDGVVDAWVYRDPGGLVTRRENDFDRDGRVDEIHVYKGGLLVEKQRATALVGRIDTWHFYTNGKLARTERDADGNTVIDQWWEYPTPDRPECPVIHSDTDGDGRPDPGASVAVCQEGAYVPPERSSDKSRPSAFDRGVGDVPTEVEEKPAPAPEGKKK